jgi:hypothetical protein
MCIRLFIGTLLFVDDKLLLCVVRYCIWWVQLVKFMLSSDNIYQMSVDLDAIKQN